MKSDSGQMSITSVEQLEEIYGESSARARIKELDHISDHYGAFIEKSPFVVVASVGPLGLDCSPRGDPAGFVRIQDRHTVLLPDRRGNNRLDTLRNLVIDPRISLLFLIPGVGETLRINGRAEISIDPELCQSFEINGKIPLSVLKVSVERIYFQCQKALVRARLWRADAQIDRKELPSTGEMLESMIKAQNAESFDGKAYDEGYAEHMKTTIY